MKDGMSTEEAVARYIEIVSKPMFMVTDEEIEELKHLERLIKKPVQFF